MFNKLIELIYPPTCIFCHQILPSSHRYQICSQCHGLVKLFEHNRSWPIRNIISDQHFDGMVCVFEYEGIVKDALKQFKFYRKPSFFRTFSAMLCERLFCVEDDISWDMVIGVPLHKDRFEERGFNQSQLLAKALSKTLNIPDASKLLEKIKPTKIQSLLSKEERFKNIRDAFQVVQPEKINSKKILLIDDILTTGSTVNECAKVLKHAGAIQVIVGVIASGQKV